MGLYSKSDRAGYSLEVVGSTLVAILILIFLMVGILLVRLETQDRSRQIREHVIQTLYSLAETLTSRIYLNIYKISAVESLVAMNPELTQDDFAKAVEVQFRGQHDLQNIVLARDLVMQYVYPLEGNEAVLGIDYRDLPGQLEAVERAIQLDEIVLAGPLELLQGGRGIIARIPITVVNELSGAEEVWGISSSVISIDSLFTDIAKEIEHNNLIGAIRGKDAMGSAGAVFWGDEAVFDQSPLTQFIELPHGSWEIGVLPRDGWQPGTVYFSARLITYYLVAATLLGLVIVVLILSVKRQKIMAALREAEDRLEKTAYELTENIPIGTYTMVQPADGGFARFAFMSRRFLEMTELTPEKAKDPSQAFSSVHPDDYDAWVAKNMQAFTGKTSFLGETRLKINDAVRWVRAESNPRTLPDGTTVWEGVLIDITEEKELKQLLIEEKEKAEAASIAKSQFLANMSHEIRTPLNGLIGFTELLKNTSLTEEQQQYVRNANISGHTLLGVISDILDFSKIEAGKMELESRRTEVRSFLQECLDVVRFSAQNKNLHLLLTVDDSVPRFAFLDPIRVKQVLVNLLSNAVKFTEKGSVELELAAQCLDEGTARLIFSVHDTGIGILESQREKLFTMFSQADTSITRKFGGTGLGLTISDMIVRKLGGRIDFRSNPGVKTTFFFDFITHISNASPQERSAAVTTPEGSVPGQNSDVSADVGASAAANSSEDSVSTATPAGSTSASVSNGNVTDQSKIARLRILIAEDVPMNMLLLKILIKKLLPSADVLEAENGQRAVDQYVAEKPDLIFMDIQMPELDGLRATSQIRKLEQDSGSHVPIIALTAGVMKEEKDQCFEVGMDHFLTKPIDAVHILDVLKKFRFLQDNE